MEDLNVILGNAHEYREPSSTSLLAMVGTASHGRIVANMTSRFVGLIVIPGEHVRKVEIEEFDPTSIT